MSFLRGLLSSITIAFGLIMPLLSGKVALQSTPATSGSTNNALTGEMNQVALSATVLPVTPSASETVPTPTPAPVRQGQILAVAADGQSYPSGTRIILDPYGYIRSTVIALLKELLPQITPAPSSVPLPSPVTTDTSVLSAAVTQLQSDLKNLQTFITQNVSSGYAGGSGGGGGSNTTVVYQVGSTNSNLIGTNLQLGNTTYSQASILASGSSIFTINPNNYTGTFQVAGNASLSNAFYISNGGKAYFTGNVGIGSTSPGYKLDVNGTIATSRIAVGASASDGYGHPFPSYWTSANLNIVGGQLSSTYDHGSYEQYWGPSTGSLYDLTGHLYETISPSGSTATYSFLNGLVVDAYDLSSTVSGGTVIGIQSNTTGPSSTSPSSSLIGVDAEVVGANSTKKVQGVLSHLNGGGATNMYGFYAQFASSNAASNAYGVYLENPAATHVVNAYGVYSAGGKNYFAGNVAIGGTASKSALAIFQTGSGAAASSSFGIRSALAAGNIASISGTGLTTGNLLRFTTPTSSSFTGNIILAKDNGGTTLFAVRASGQIQARSGIFSHGSQNGCTGSGSPAGACIDYAEDMPLNSSKLQGVSDNSQMPKPGDIVTIDPTSDTFAVMKAITSYDRNMLGIVSTNPAITIGDSVRQGEFAKQSPMGSVPVALAGRVPVKVSDENGVIKKGDYLTSSAKISGAAMKATKKGRVIGIALEDQLPDHNTVMLLINPHYAGEELDANGQLADFSGSTVLQSKDGTLNVSTLVSAVVSYFADEFEIMISKGLIRVEHLAASLVSADKIQATEVETQSGVTTYDRQTGDAYCMYVSAGQVLAAKGSCGGDTSTSAPVISPSVAPSMSPSSSPEASISEEATPTPTSTAIPEISVTPTPNPSVSETAIVTPSISPEPTQDTASTPTPSPEASNN